MAEEFIRFAALGVGAGGLYALAAVGVVVVYRCSGVVNFAQGAVGMVGAYVYYEATVVRDIPWPVAMILGFGGSALVGVGFHFGVMQRLRHASVLSRVVATIALLVSLQSIALLRYGGFPKRVPSVLPNGRVEILGTAVGQDRVAILAIALLLTGGLWTVYRFTPFGIATSAVAENPRGAAALGVSPSAIAAVNWAVGSALGALATILLIPITGLEPVSTTFVVIPVLAAAVVGRFSSFPVTMGAGVLIGVAQSLVASPKLVANHWQQPGLATAVPFILVALVLTVRGRSVVGKDEIFGRMPRVGSGRLSIGWIVSGLVGSLVLVWMVFPEDLVVAMQTQVTLAVVLLSFVVVTGYAGQVSLAQSALAGVGALVCGWLHVAQDWPLELAAPVGVLATIPVAICVGSAGIRTRGVNLAIVTLGFAIAVGPAVLTNPDYTRGPNGEMRVDEMRVLGIDLTPTTSPERYATFCVVIFAVLGIMVANLRRGRSGRRLLAVRTNERAAAALGVSVVGAKLYAFTLGGVIAAVGGILIVYSESVLSYGRFGGIASVFTLQNAVIGGVGMVAGPVVGSGFQPGTLGQEMAGTLPGDASLVVVLIGGAGLLVLLSVAPDGLAELVSRMAGRFGPPRDRAKWTAEVSAVAPDVAPERWLGVPPRTLRTAGLSVRFGGTEALVGLDLHVGPGEVVGLIGPNGAGKSTAVEAMTGFIEPADGSVFIDEVDIGGWTTERRARAGLSRSFQSLELFDDLTVLENIQAACEPRDLASYVTDLVRPGQDGMTPAGWLAIDEFGLRGALHRRAEELSYAERRMLAVARAVAVGSSILLLDEPASGLDDAQTRELGDTIRRLANEHGVAVLVIEHNVDMVLRVCDRIHVLDFGREIGAGSPSEIRASERVVDAYLGTTHFRAGPTA